MLAGCPKMQYPNCKNDSECTATVDGVARSGVCVFGKCQECSKDPDCKDGKVCRDNMCETLCKADSDCGNGMFCADDGLCRVACSDANKCSDGRACMNGKCMNAQVGCHGAADCEAGYNCVSGTCTKSEMTTDYNSVFGSDRTAFFDFDKYNLKSEGMAVLQKIATGLKSMPNVNVTVAGYTDDRGTAEYNLALGERRAHAAAKYLQSLGVAKSRIKVISYGLENPLDPANNAAAWAKNRRAVVVIPQ